MSVYKDFNIQDPDSPLSSDIVTIGNIILQMNLTLEENQFIKIESGEILTVPEGKTLTLNDGSEIRNYGTLTNNGTIDNNGEIYQYEGATITNLTKVGAVVKHQATYGFPGIFFNILL